MSSSPRNFNDDDHPTTPKTPKATRHSRSRDDESIKAPRKPQKAVSFKKFAPDSPPLAPKALSFADIDSSTATTEPAVRKNSREFRRSVSPSPADTEQAVVVAKPRERQADHWVKFHKVSLGRARTAKMNHNEWAEVAEE